MDRLIYSIFIWIQLILVYIPGVKGQDSTDDVSKAFVTLAVLSGALIISVIMAKIFDYCYDRSTLRDDASDISEHTRKIIRQRLAVMKFAKKEKAKTAMTQVQRASHVLRVWSEKSKRRGSDRSVLGQGAPPFVISGNQLQPGQKPKTVDFAKDVEDPNFRSTLNVPTLPDDMRQDNEPSQTEKDLPKPLNETPICIVDELNETEKPEVNYVYLPQDSGVGGAKPDTSEPKPEVEATKIEIYPTSLPRAETKSAKAMNKPKFFPLKPNDPPGVQPLYKSTQNNDSQTLNSPSPPKIFIKQPTETDFESKFSRNLSSPRKIAPLPQTSTIAETPNTSRKKASDSGSRPGRAESVSKGGTGRPRVLSSPSGRNIDKKGVHFKTSPKNRKSVTAKSR